MQIDEDTWDYLRGERFSNGRAFKLGPQRRGQRRGDRLVQLVQGKKVLHVGCCDHLDLIRDKVRRGVYLHQRLTSASQRCVGMDINPAGIALLRELGFTDTFLPDDVPQDDYDMCLLADVIEHVGDVVSFLQSMRRWRFRELIVVTPNMFRLRNWISGGELINTDHRYWFSPFTLCKVLADAGYRPLEVELMHADHVSWRGALAARAMDFLPKYRESLIVRAQPRPAD